jgi:hypothetical protein
LETWYTADQRSGVPSTSESRATGVQCDTRQRAEPQPRIDDSILDAIGRTPLVRLSRLGAGLTPAVVAKVESLNPGGSVKDRVAVALMRPPNATAACGRAERSSSRRRATSARAWRSRPA